MVEVSQVLDSMFSELEAESWEHKLKPATDRNFLAPMSVLELLKTKCHLVGAI